MSNALNIVASHTPASNVAAILALAGHRGARNLTRTTGWRKSLDKTARKKRLGVSRKLQKFRQEVIREISRRPLGKPRSVQEKITTRSRLRLGQLVQEFKGVQGAIIKRSKKEMKNAEEVKAELPTIEALVKGKVNLSRTPRYRALVNTLRKITTTRNKKKRSINNYIQQRKGYIEAATRRRNEMQNKYNALIREKLMWEGASKRAK